ncbi:MAG: SPOR domain-containing protein [Gammaproteobacteria bacterium]|nr:SPOR domain-containing protein [Gammaproteobacteria bacterium]
MERQLQERLTGAAILVVLAAIFIPLILDEPVTELPPVEPPPPPPAVDFDPGFQPAKDAAEEVAGEAGTAPLKGVVLDGLPEVPPSPPPSAAAEPPSAAVKPPSSPPSAAAKPPPAAVKSPSPPPSAAAKPPPLSPAAAGEGTGAPDDGDAWVVQMGSFARRKNADALQDRLRKAGYRAFVSQHDSGGEAVYRVQVGPELSRRTAARQRDELRQKLKIKGIIQRYP